MRTLAFLFALSIAPLVASTQYSYSGSVYFAGGASGTGTLSQIYNLPSTGALPLAFSFVVPTSSQTNGTDTTVYNDDFSLTRLTLTIGNVVLQPTQNRQVIIRQGATLANPSQFTISGSDASYFYSLNLFFNNTGNQQIPSNLIPLIANLDDPNNVLSITSLTAVGPQSINDFDNFNFVLGSSLSLTSAQIPEPGTFATALGAVVLLLLPRYRR